MSHKNNDGFYVMQNGVQTGPYTEDDLYDQLEAGNISESAYVWQNGMDDWSPIGDAFPVDSEDSYSPSNRAQRYGGQFGTVIIVMLVLAWNGLLPGCGRDREKQVPPQTFSAATSAPPISSPRVEVEPSIELMEFAVRWTLVSRGITVMDGRLWVPEVKLTLKNESDRNIDRYYLQVLFLNEKGVITSEVKEGVQNIPAGYAKGPVFLQGSVGYASDSPFFDMVNDRSRRWNYELFWSTSYSGPWKKLRSGHVSNPNDYPKEIEVPE